MTSDMPFSIDPPTDELARVFTQLGNDLRRVDDLNFLKRIKPSAELTRWTYATKGAVCLSGISRGHPLLSDGPILTSEVFYLNFELGLARTYSRWYRLIGPARTGDYPTN